jgi:hypothetical protein
LIAQVAPNVQRYNEDFTKEARHYTPRMKMGSGFVPWVDDETKSETLLTQFEVNTHGATNPYNSMTIFEKDDELYGRCALCVHDVNLSHTKRVRTVKHITRTSLLNVAQHSCSKSHQASKLAYLRGIRDTLKHIAHNPLRNDTYKNVVEDCHRLEEKLRDIMRDAPTNAPTMASEGGPTPDTTNKLFELCNTK